QLSPITLKRSSTVSASLAAVWRDVQGCNNWQGMVEPLDPILCHEIVRYGEFVKACYKTFDLDPTSNRYLNCKYGKSNLLREVGLEDSGYEVTKYIYATPPLSTTNIVYNFNNNNSNSIPRWIGYVAVSSDQEAVNRLGRRDVVVTFRGTVTNPEWMANLMSSLTPARLDPHNSRPQVKVETGFHSLYTNADKKASKFGLGSCREQLLSQVSGLLDNGHSMGSSLALLLAYDIAELGLNTRRGGGHSMNVPITVFSFGGPRVGNSSFKQRCEELGIKVLRIVNVNDPITRLPGVFFNENFRVLGDNYAHVGVELQVGVDFLKIKNPSYVHDLETYISLLRCPTTSSVRVQSQGANNERPYHCQILDRAKELFHGTTKTFNKFPWINAASDAVNLVHSQR
ncbi:Phospholipase A(1), partial [Bertholletia excelsa]